MQLLFCSLRPPGGRGEEKNEIAKALFAVKASEKTLPFFQRRNELECAFILFSSPLFCPHRPQNPLQLLHFAPFCSILALFFFPLCFFSLSLFSLSLSMTLQTPHPLELRGLSRRMSVFQEAKVVCKALEFKKVAGLRRKRGLGEGEKGQLHWGSARWILFQKNILAETKEEWNSFERLTIFESISDRRPAQLRRPRRLAA